MAEVGSVLGSVDVSADVAWRREPCKGRCVGDEVGRGVLDGGDSV